MLMTQWQPSSVWDEMNRLQNEMNRLFGRWETNGPRVLGEGVYPPLNLWEDDNNLYVEAELPGFELDDLEIFVTGENQLSLKGERKQPKVAQGAWHRRERGYGNFNRMIELPCPVQSDNVTAEFKHGVLTINLAKHEGAKPRKIEVRSN